MKPEDFVRGREVAFDELRVGEWYFDVKHGLFTVVGKSQFANEWLVDCPDVGGFVFCFSSLPFFEALPKPKVEYRTGLVHFYFCDYRHGAKCLRTTMFTGTDEWGVLREVASAVVEVGSDGSVRIVGEGEA